MKTRALLPLLVCILSISCSQTTAPANNTNVAVAAETPRPAPTPGKNFTAADVAKIKWLEGSWRGMDGDKPFYERYKFEGTTMIVQNIKEDLSPDGDPERYELVNGEFGKGEGDKRTAASEMTAEYVQFVPANAGASNSYRFHKRPNGTWQAILEWQAKGDKPAGNKIYSMEYWPLRKDPK